MLPTVLSESLVHLVDASQNTPSSQEMCHQGKCYKLFQAFGTHDRLKAYTVSCDLSEKGMTVLVTASKSRYAIWVEPSYA